MKERVELEIKTINDAIESLGYLHIDEIKGKELLELIEDMQEKQRIAIEALESVFKANMGNWGETFGCGKIAEQALSTIRGK